jgi:hypothetical protein
MEAIVENDSGLSLDSLKGKFDTLDTGDIIVLSSAGISCAMMFIAGASIAFPMLSAFFTSVGLIYMFYAARENKWGARFWNLMMEYPVMTDIATGALLVVLFGTATSAALLASGAAGVMTSAVMILVRKFSKNNGKVAV